MEKDFEKIIPYNPNKDFILDKKIITEDYILNEKLKEAEEKINRLK